MSLLTSLPVSWRRLLPLALLAGPLTACGHSPAASETAASAPAHSPAATPVAPVPAASADSSATLVATAEAAPAVASTTTSKETVPALPPARVPAKATALPAAPAARPVAAVAVSAAPAAPAASPSDQLAAETTALLQKHVDANGQVNYAALKRDPARLNALLKTVAGFKAADASAVDRKAFFLNAYNLLVIGEVVARYPLASVEKVPGFFDKNLVTVAGEKLTLNDLETKKVRDPYKDPRIHFALVCAAKGCPTLSRTAYVGSRLDAQLTAQARRVLQDAQFIRVSDTDKTARLSQIFKWYADDFKASGKTGVAYINQFRSQPIPSSYSVDYYEYNWALNEAGR